MKRMSLFGLIVIALPALALAQTPPPPPSPPPAPPVAPAPPTPPTPARFLDPIALVDAVRAGQMMAIDTTAMQDAVRAASTAASSIDASMYAQAVAAAAQGRGQQIDVRPVLGAQQFMLSTTAEGSNYNSGLNAEMDRQYEQAIARFDRVITAKGAHADGALYHKAWCQAQLGKPDEATATLAALKSGYPQSPYLKDARQLEADVRKLGPGQVDDTDIKLLAISAMQNQNPDQSIPLLEAVLNGSKNSLQLKRQALFVLAGIDQPRAHQLLLSYAKGAGNPDLQMKAIGYLGNRNQKTSGQELIEIYNSTPDVEVRTSVIGAFSRAGDKGSLMTIYNGGMGRGSTTVASTATAGGRGGAGMGAGTGAGGRGASAQGGTVNAERMAAINGLAELATPQELWPLYQKEENRDLRMQWVNAFSSMRATDQLLQIVKTEKDPTVRARAIRGLGNLGGQTGSTLVELYATGDKDTKESVIGALGNQKNVDSLIALYRKESDVSFKKQIVSRLVDLSRESKTAMDFLTEILK